jgi:hypothetical protein
MSNLVTRATSDDRRQAIERAVKVKALAQLAREIGIDEALKIIGAAMDRTPRETAAVARRAFREKIVAEIIRIENDGRPRSAVSIVVSDHVLDKNDPIEVDSLRRKFQRWRDAEKRTPVRLPAAKSI